MSTTTRRNRLTTAVIVVGIFGLGMAAGHATAQHEATEQARLYTSTTDPIRTEPVIPRCVHDDFNDGSQALCYTVTTSDEVVVIDATDEVVSRG